MPLALLFIQYSFNAQHVSAVNTTIFRSLRLIGSYFMGGIWFGVCWRSVSMWLWRCGVFMHKDTTPPTHTEPDYYYFIQYSFNAQHVSAVNTTIVRSLRLIGIYFMGCVWCGVFMQSEALLTKLNSVAFNPRANYTERAAAAGRRS